MYIWFSEANIYRTWLCVNDIPKGNPLDLLTGRGCFTLCAELTELELTPESEDFSLKPQYVLLMLPLRWLGVLVGLPLSHSTSPGIYLITCT